MYLYTVYRNKDDKLMILDGTAWECCDVLGIRPSTLYTYQCKSRKNRPYTITKIKLKDVEN